MLILKEHLMQCNQLVATCYELLNDTTLIVPSELAEELRFLFDDASRTDWATINASATAELLIAPVIGVKWILVMVFGLALLEVEVSITA
jgi:hypothetical protein